MLKIFKCGRKILNFNVNPFIHKQQFIILKLQIIFTTTHVRKMQRERKCCFVMQGISSIDSFSCQPKVDLQKC